MFILYAPQGLLGPLFIVGPSAGRAVTMSEGKECREACTGSYDFFSEVKMLLGLTIPIGQIKNRDPPNFSEGSIVLPCSWQEEEPDPIWSLVATTEQTTQ